MKKVYVASALANYQRVLNLQHQLRWHGIVPAFDWAATYRDAPGMETEEDKARIAKQELDAVMGSDAFLLVLPGKRGAHVEYGIALGSCVPTVVLCESEADAISFHKLPCTRFCKAEAEAIVAVLEAVEDYRS